MRSLLAFSDHPARNFFAFAPAACPDRSRRALGPAVFGFRSAGLQPGILSPVVPASFRLAGYAVAGSRRGAVRRGARSSNSRVHSDSAGAPPACPELSREAAPATTNSKSAANWPRRAFRSAGVPPALLISSSVRQTVGFAQHKLAARFGASVFCRGAACCARSSHSRAHTDLAGLSPAVGFDHETFYVVGSYPNIGTRTNTAVVCRAGGENDL
jgi:hypothetical protein